jgi:peptidoglycan/LPS O-acetylase OafA/YrhL
LTKTNHTVFFPGLNSLRFFAAFAVLLTHVEFTKKLLGHGEGLWVDFHQRGAVTAFHACLQGKMSWIAPLLTMLGELGVVFFFVLSGFLITYLLLKERDVKGKISVGKFYARRLLRIWPLYLLVVVLGFFVLPRLEAFEIFQQQRYLWYGFWAQFVLYVVMLPNLSFAHFNIAIPNIGQAWSIGVEEQFYLIWPWLVSWFKNVGSMVVFFVAGLIGLKIIVSVCPEGIFEWLPTVKRFLGMTKMECMAIGAYGAFAVYHQRQRFMDLVYRPWVQIAAVAAIVPIVYFTPIALMPLMHLYVSVVFLIIILNVATNPKSILKLRFQWLDFLGRISYGIYMYHMMIITLVIYLVKGRIKGFEQLTAWENILVYTISTGLTILVASLSYRYFETPWMKMKDRFTTIVSGEAARNNKGNNHV